MCTSPIRLENKSDHPLSPKYIYVPCNKCLSCQKSKQDGMEYRAIKEYEYCEKHGGKVYFLTFTYDNEHLPIMRTFSALSRIGNTFFGKMPCDAIFTHVSKNNDFNVHKEEIYHRWYEYTEEPCHDKKDLQNFNKRLRDQLKRDGYDVMISFLICSEYGSDDEYQYHGKIRKATSRPHYHALYFLVPLSGSLPTDQQFLDLAFKKWGMCQKQCFKSHLIDNKVLSAIAYTTKYITKQDANKEFASRCIKSDSGHSFQIFNRKKQLFEDCKECRVAPFHLVSNNFGAKHLNVLDPEKILSIITKKATIINQNGTTYNMPFPAYYRKKYLYDTKAEPKNILCESFSVKPHSLSDDEYFIEDEILFPYYEHHTKTSMKDFAINKYIQDKSVIIENLYSCLCAYWFSLEDKPFSFEYLKFGLKDYLFLRDMDSDLRSGEFIPNADILHLSVFYNIDISEADHYKTKIENFIFRYQTIHYQHTNDKLFIQRDKQRKRAAERKFINKFHAR